MPLKNHNYWSVKNNLKIRCHWLLLFLIIMEKICFKNYINKKYLKKIKTTKQKTKKDKKYLKQKPQPQVSRPLKILRKKFQE